jgi:hypothetical protein
MASENNIYPNLATNDPLSESFDKYRDKNNYRLTLITNIQKKLEQEREVRRSLYKKYKKGVNVIEGINGFFIVVGIGGGATGIVALTTVIGAPIAIILESVAVGGGLLSAIGRYVRRKLETKAKKHNDIRLLADAKLNTISTQISRVLQDGAITDIEFNLITEEEQKYKTMKDAIKSRVTRSIKENSKKVPPAQDAFLKKTWTRFLRQICGRSANPTTIIKIDITINAPHEPPPYESLIPTAHHLA